MIPISVLLALFGLGVLFTTIPFIDNRNRIYGNIVMFAVSTLIWFLIAFFMITGSVGESVPVVSSLALNETSGITNYTYIPRETPFVSPTLMYFFTFLGIVTMVFGILAALEAVYGPITGSEEEGTGS